MGGARAQHLAHTAIRHISWRTHSLLHVEERGGAQHPAREVVPSAVGGESGCSREKRSKADVGDVVVEGTTRQGNTDSYWAEDAKRQRPMPINA
eukprot:1233424-Pyramimonas_sp.AAC.1